MPGVLRDGIHIIVVPCFLVFEVDLKTAVGCRGLLQKVKVDDLIGRLKSSLGWLAPSNRQLTWQKG